MTQHNGSEPASEIIQLGKTQEGYVVLPYGKEEFRQFIENLLGSPQTITRTVGGNYEVDRNDLFGIHQLIIQRVAQQNGGILAKFAATLHYADSSIIELNRIEDVVTYEHTRASQAIQVSLMWHFIVQFQDKSVPEKQSVLVDFHTNSFRGYPHRYAAYADYESFGGMSVRVAHTARTWGVDIEALLVDKLRSFVREYSPLRALLRSNSETLGLTVGSATMIAGVYMLTRFNDLSTAKRLNADLERLRLAQHTSAIESKLDLLARFLVKEITSSAGVWMLMGVLVTGIVSVFLGVFINNLAEKTSLPSFILLGKADRDLKDKAVKNANRGVAIVLGTIVGDIVLNVIGNIVTSYVHR
jgi:hypothetical protein